MSAQVHSLSTACARRPLTLPLMYIAQGAGDAGRYASFYFQTYARDERENDHSDHLSIYRQLEALAPNETCNISTNPLIVPLPATQTSRQP